MKRVTIKAYAKEHKLSIYNVIKMTREGRLKTEKAEENGKEVVYIIVDDAIEEEIVSQTLPVNPPKSLKEENALLKAEIKRLKEALAKCKKHKS